MNNYYNGLNNNNNLPPRNGPILFELFSTINNLGQRVRYVQRSIVQIPPHPRAVGRVEPSQMFETLNMVVDMIMEIYPDLGEGTNAQNLTEEQTDIIKNILSSVNLPQSSTLINMILREVILRTDIKTTLSQTDLNNLETKKFSEIQGTGTDVRCAICITEFTGDDLVRIMQCKHFFHKDCIDIYLEKYNNKCPMCRESQAPGPDTDTDTDTSSELMYDVV
jgi:hypothetical protein